MAKNYTRRSILGGAGSLFGISLAGCSQRESGQEPTNTASPSASPTPPIQRDQFYSTPLDGSKVYNNHMNAISEKTFEALEFLDGLRVKRVETSPGGPAFIWRNIGDNTYRESHYDGEEIYRKYVDGDSTEFYTTDMCGRFKTLREPTLLGHDEVSNFGELLDTLKFAYEGVFEPGSDYNLPGGHIDSRIQVYKALTPKSISESKVFDKNYIENFNFQIGIDRNKIIRVVVEICDSTACGRDNVYIIDRIGGGVHTPEWLNNAKAVIDEPETC